MNKINNLNFSKPDIKRFKSLKILRQLPHKDSLFETILITTNDELVHMFLNKQIEYEKLVLYLIKH